MTAARRIDTHQHIVPPAYAQWLTSLGITAGGRSIPEWHEDAALEVMADNDIVSAVVSVSTPAVEPAGQEEARAMARTLNAFCADLRDRMPDRFGFFATLTLPDVEGAVREACHALDELGADGVTLLANSKGIYLGDPSFDPLMEQLNRRSAVVFVHPSALPAEPVPGLPAYAADFLLDTTRAAVNLARSGCLERYPDVKVLLSHAGGFVPYAAERLAQHCAPDGTPGDGLERLRRFYYDTALSSSPYALPSLLAFADPTHITYGSDWPYAPSAKSARFAGMLDDFHLTESQRHAINRGNAEQLFPRLASALPSGTSPQPQH
ncbi:amidohydrolase family protein [Streptomyces sp. LHD-70]|uniref:amidohydrolase family protein n=1 Tax=Streptomyces sp. LHD-70 TaxID=3072140 RepID=UPI00280FD68A|nr:amidohydrolase family protein [Streptomyces sp. LHD-70]MDQ8705428.1 amidohydrolase family protein [Streptomyces sp. LHD-70]